MTNRDITHGEFIQATRGIIRFKYTASEENTPFTQIIGRDKMELSFTLSFSNDTGYKVLNLRVITNSKKGLSKTVNLLLNKSYKRDFYNIIKALAEIQ